MPEILEISDLFSDLGARRMALERRTGVHAPRVPAPKTIPLRELRTPVKITEVDRRALERAMRTIRTAQMEKAVAGTRLALIALANGRFEEAGQIAVNSAIEAAAAFRQNPEMGARVFTTARGIVRNAIRGIMARSV